MLNYSLLVTASFYETNCLYLWGILFTFIMYPIGIKNKLCEG
jgi:hypothetical protein